MSYRLTQIAIVTVCVCLLKWKTLFECDGINEARVWLATVVQCSCSGAHSSAVYYHLIWGFTWRRNRNAQSSISRLSLLSKSASGNHNPRDSQGHDLRDTYSRNFSIYTSTYLFTFIYLLTYLQLYIYLLTFMYLLTYLHLYIYILIYIYIFTYLFTFICTYPFTFINYLLTFIYLHTHLCSYNIIYLIFAFI